jgi:hypothetical protein
MQYDPKPALPWNAQVERFASAQLRPAVKESQYFLTRYASANLTHPTSNNVFRLDKPLRHIRDPFLSAGSQNLNDR